MKEHLVYDLLGPSVMQLKTNWYLTWKGFRYCLFLETLISCFITDFVYLSIYHFCASMDLLILVLKYLLFQRIPWIWSRVEENNKRSTYRINRYRGKRRSYDTVIHNTKQNDDGPSVRPSARLKLKILVTAEPIGFSSLGNIPNGPVVVLGHVHKSWDPPNPPPPPIKKKNFAPP